MLANNGWESERESEKEGERTLIEDADSSSKKEIEDAAEEWRDGETDRRTRIHIVHRTGKEKS